MDVLQNDVTEAEKMIEILVDLYQSVMTIYFLTRCLHIAPGRKASKVFIIGCMLTFSYLVIQSKINVFEGSGILIYMLISFPICLVYMDGSFVKKLIYNIVLIIILIFSAVIAGSIISFIFETNYIDMVYNGGKARYLAIVLNQIILTGCIIAITKQADRLKELRDYAYAVTAAMIPLISIFLCGMVLRIDNGDIHGEIYVIAVIVGIAIINIINFILMAKEQQRYHQMIKEKVRLTALEYQRADIDEIKRVHRENERARHEFERIINMIDSLLTANSVEEARRYITNVTSGRILPDEGIVYTSNIIINHVLNRKNRYCREKGISFSCLVEGELSGIDDLDFHILIENLLDNAIEAAENSNDKMINLMIYSDKTGVGIELSNSIMPGALNNNPLFKTTKDDKEHHGYGMDNIRYIVNKYNGRIIYKNISHSMIMFKIVLIIADNK